MVLLPFSLPSIQTFSSDIWEILDAGELVILSSPATNTGKRWTQAILDALDSIARQKGEAASTRLDPLQGDCAVPLPIMASALDLTEIDSVADLLECFGREPVVVLTLCCNNGLSSGWRELFLEIARNYRTIGAEVRQRPILAVLLGCAESPPIGARVGIRVRELWNVFRWEEIRLLVESGLDSNENALVRAWRIAVYSASANGDPDIAALLCRERPNSLRETVECCLATLMCSSPSTNANLSTPFVADQKWNVPSTVVQQWSNGQIAGSTLERGVSFNTEYMERADAQAYLLHAIWREQVAGLLPVVMEVGFSVNQAVTHEIGPCFLEDLPQEVRPGGQLYLEPREVIQRIEERADWWVPNTIWKMLQLLKRTRNALAHMRPVDQGLIRDLWQQYDIVRRRFIS